MLTRINFLLAVGLLVVILFWLAGSHLIVALMSLLSPGWVKPVAGVAVLAGLGVTVQILSMVMSGMAGAASYSKTGGPTALGLASQAAIVCGHGALGYGTAIALSGERPLSDAGLLLIAALYGAGVAIAYVEWRARPKGPSGAT